MDMREVLSAIFVYLKVLIVYVIVDVLYLLLPPVAAFHQEVIEQVQGSPVELRVAPAVAVYAVGAGALSWVLSHAPVGRRVLSAAFMGFCSYGIYDLTNYATLTRYPLEMVVRDMLWGAASFGISAFIYTRLLARCSSTSSSSPSSSSSPAYARGVPTTDHAASDEMSLGKQF